MIQDEEKKDDIVQAQPQLQILKIELINKYLKDLITEKNNIIIFIKNKLYKLDNTCDKLLFERYIQKKLNLFQIKS